MPSLNSQPRELGHHFAHYGRKQSDNAKTRGHQQEKMRRGAGRGGGGLQEDASSVKK